MNGCILKIAGAENRQMTTQDIPMKDLVADLVHTRELISTPAKWAKGISGPGLCILDAVGLHNPHAVHEVADALEGYLPTFPISSLVVDHPVAQFNDLPEVTHADILALIDRTISGLSASSSVGS